MQSHRILQDIWKELGDHPEVCGNVSFTTEGALPSAFLATDLASASIAAAALSVSELIRLRASKAPHVSVDRRLASFWFGLSIRPIGWSLPPAWDPIAGDYQTSDGWIRLHTNAPHHRAAAEGILGAHGDKDEVTRAVRKWRKRDLEEAIVAAKGCAAEMLSLEEWAKHPQGQAVASEPLVISKTFDEKARLEIPFSIERPLQGIRVLDLTRVLAGPVATRFLAGYGADVLRIDPPGWDEPMVAQEVTLGKRCARLDLHSRDDRRIFEKFLSEAHVLVHGYRAGALDHLGYDVETRRRLSPGLVDISLNAYGWSGTFKGRRGFDSLVQMSTGIAHAGMIWRNADKPVPLPVQALDHATGYLMAAAAIRGIARRISDGQGFEARMSLAHAAKLLVDHRVEETLPPFDPENDRDLSPTLEKTIWGEARRIKAPAQVDGSPMAWALPATALGSAEPTWPSD